MEKINREIIKLSETSDFYWRNYTRIRTIGYLSIKEYYDKTLKNLIYNRENEGILFREYEASILLNTWSSTHYDPKQYMVVDTIIFFFNDFKKKYPWTWKVNTNIFPFLCKIKEFVDLIRKISKESLNVSIS